MIKGSDLVLSTSIVLRDLDWQDRASRAAELGYRVVESWWPWPYDVATEVDCDMLAASLSASDTQLYLLNLTEGDPQYGRRGLAGIPTAEDAFWSNAESMMQIASRTGLSYVNALAGNVTASGRTAGIETLVSRITSLADRVAALGVGIVIEQLNNVDNPDYLLTDPDDAVAVVREIRAKATHANVGLLADVYHLGRAGVDPVAFVRTHASLIDHVQLADAPGRGAPGTGALPILETLDALSELNYPGRVGLEFQSEPGYSFPQPDELIELLRRSSLHAKQDGA